MAHDVEPTPAQQETNPGGSQRIPWLWLVAGLAITVIGCLLAALLLRAFLLEPPPEASGPPGAQIIVLTAPPSPTPAATRSSLPPTPIPTFTPIPTPNVAVAPEAITAGFYAVVANTDGLGVTVRGGPGTTNVALAVAEEGTLVSILDGPDEADNFLWWQVRLPDATTGWVVADYLEPAAAP